jgi:hypothetical protein
MWQIAARVTPNSFASAACFSPRSMRWRVSLTQQRKLSQLWIFAAG